MIKTDHQIQQDRQEPELSYTAAGGQNGDTTLENKPAVFLKHMPTMFKSLHCKVFTQEK